LAGLWFFLGLTFAVKGLDPVTPAITINRPRYLTTGLPFALLTIWGFLFAATRARHRLTHARHGVLYGLGLCGLLWLAYGSRFSGWSQHPLAIAAREQRAFNAAFAAGEPIVLRDKSREPLQAALALYWDPGAFGNRYRDFPRVKRLPGGGERRYFVEDPSHGIDADRVRRAIQTGEPILWLSRRIVSDDIRPFDKRGVLVVERVE
jgi:hypothetical protein